MQANNDQNWTEDGAFWDEAWTDMSSRLDENPPHRKRGAAWWWFVGGFLALLLVVTPVVVGSVFSGDGGQETRPTPLKAPAPHPAAAPEKEVYADNAVADQDANAPKTTATTATVTQGPLQIPGVPQGNPAELKAVKTNETAATPSSKEVGTTPEIALVPPPARAGESPAEGTPPRAVSAAVSALPRAALTAFPVPNTWVLPAVEVGRARRTELYLEAGALSTGLPNVSGYYAGVGYRLPLGKQLSFPFSLRYRRESLPVGDFPASGSVDLAFVDPSVSADSVVNVGNPVNGANRLNFTDLRTEAVELATGISYAFTPRLRATVGLNVAYMTRAELYVSSVPNASGFSQENSFNLLDNASEFRNVLDANFADRVDGAVPDLDPLQFRGNLSLSYELTPRLGVSAAGTYLLRQPDRAKVIGIPAARAEVGLRWRLR